MGYFQTIFEALNKSKIKYLVVGGVAVNIHGYLRFTGDIDILLLLEEKNLEKMDKTMKKLKYQERLPVTITDLKNHAQVRKWIKEKNMTAYSYSPPVDNPLIIDILAEESLKFEKYAKNKIRKKFQNTVIPIVSIDDLIYMKKKANREKDIQDLENLIQLKDL